MSRYESRSLEPCEVATAILGGTPCVVVKSDSRTQFMSVDEFSGLLGISAATHTVYNITVEKSPSGVSPVEITTVFGVGSPKGPANGYVVLDTTQMKSHGTRLTHPNHKTYLRYICPIADAYILATDNGAPVCDGVF